MNTSDNIELLLSSLSSLTDEEINLVIDSKFNNDIILGGLDASSLFILLIKEKDRSDGVYTTHFNMENF